MLQVICRSLSISRERLWTLFRGAPAGYMYESQTLPAPAKKHLRPLLPPCSSSCTPKRQVPATWRPGGSEEMRRSLHPGVRCSCTACHLPEFASRLGLLALDCGDLSRDGPWLPILLPPPRLGKTSANSPFVSQRQLHPPSVHSQNVESNLASHGCKEYICQGDFLCAAMASRIQQRYGGRTFWILRRWMLRSLECVWVPCAEIWECGCDHGLCGEIIKCT